MVEKLFNGNLRAAIDLLEATKDNLDTLWQAGECRLTAGEIQGLRDATNKITVSLSEISEIVGNFDQIVLK